MNKPNDVVRCIASNADLDIYVRKPINGEIYTVYKAPRDWACITWGGSVEVIQNDMVNDKKPFYALYGSIGGEFDRVTITVKMGVTSLKQMDSLERTTHIVYGGSFEYRVVPNLGIVVGSDSACDTLLCGLVYHFGEK